MTITKEEFQKRLDAISEYNGRPYGRAYRLFDAEDKHSKKCIKYKGYLALSDAFKCLFLETVELLNTECPPKAYLSLSESYALFVPGIVYNFISLCGAERLAIKGYPYHACTLLRNTFDNLVLASAALQKITDFASIEGIQAGKRFNARASKKLRKDTEFEVRKNMTGAHSGLSQTTIDQLAKLDTLFDYEVHGGRLSLTDAEAWMKGQGHLPVLPVFREISFAMFMNRYCEVAWMTHRLLPLMQPPQAPLTHSWKDKWRIQDESFESTVEALTIQAGKKAGAAVVEFVKVKFPFNQDSVFSL